MIVRKLPMRTHFSYYLQFTNLQLFYFFTDKKYTGKNIQIKAKWNKLGGIFIIVPERPYVAQQLTNEKKGTNT